MIWSERNAVHDIQAKKEIGKEVLSVSAEKVDPAREGALIHLHGPAATGDTVGNPQFGIEENAIRLSWDAEIFEWVEKKDSVRRHPWPRRDASCGKRGILEAELAPLDGGIRARRGP